MCFDARFRPSRIGGWVEQGSALWCCVVGQDGSSRWVEGSAKGELIRGLLASSVRVQPEPEGQLYPLLRENERDRFFELWRPSEAEIQQRTLHAVTPLLAAIVAAA